MIRFRFREDEKRYVSLLSEVYRLVAATVPPAEVSVVMRNLGKLQDMLMLEGVRQGVAAAAISNIAKSQRQGDKEELKAFQLHAHVYGSQDTPLRDIEMEWLHKLQAEALADSPWLDDKPMRFAPETERQFRGELRRETGPKSWASWSPEDIADEVAPWPDPKPTPDDSDLLDELGVDNADDVDLDDVIQAIEGTDDAQERPQLLDRIRDVLMDMGKSGLRPRDWQSLILRLHLALHVDAGAIDMQLGTQMGQTVLAQAGFHDVRPGPFGLNLQEVYEQAEQADQVIRLEGQTEAVEVPIPSAVAPTDDSSPEDE